MIISDKLVISKKKYAVGGLGEVLWDIFPETNKLGGAPANFAAHAQQLGANSFLLSAVGKDLLGKKTIANLLLLKVNTSGIQVKEDFATGRVNVRLDQMGNPSYDIQENVAWDHIEFDTNINNIVQGLDAICFGTLAQRNSIAKKSILKMIKSTTHNCLKVFDVNFRQDFYTSKMVEQSLDLANAVKMNEDEFSIIATMISLPKNHEKGLQLLIRKFNLNFGIITLGKNGSVMASLDHFYRYSSKNTAKVKSTVGAGDAFTAAAVMGWLDKKPLKHVIKEASNLATYVCCYFEAVPSKK